ncbi:exostosin-like 1 isoform X3 [Equus quagga]|uniref:exostosin-like 1 isoform X3 n=1 Tax=Equus quagga TaxID=89248 RepID=UPI001EE2E1F9|nr:exostosin-like 1 isoform X3 [Equus quagga]
MQSWRRKALLLALSASWLLVLLGAFPLLRLAVPTRPRAGASQGWPRWLDAELLQSFSQPGELLEDAPELSQGPRGGSCDWGACFDASKCRGGGLKVFVYSAAGPVSETHRRILASIEGSRYHTSNAAEACLLLLPLTRDSSAGECSPVPPQWNGGRNHLVLSLHPALCPRTFQLGQAIVAEASPTVDTFRTHPGATLPNATFCLIPGHRPDASHFLQALQAGCIPVLLSPRWELPFSEVIDWTKAAIVTDKRLPLQVLAALQQMPLTRVLALRQQTQFLWDAYFSSVEKVIHTTLEIIQDRIFGASAHPSLLWNSPPGALLALSTFSTSPSDFPFYHVQQGSRPVGRFSALIWVGAPGKPPLKLIQAVAGSQHCAQHSFSEPQALGSMLRMQRKSRKIPPQIQIQILVLWSSEKPPPPRWPETAVPLTVSEGHRKVSDRFFPYNAISTDAILSLDAHSSLSTSEVDFAFVVWQSFPERMVGFLTWSHFWDEALGGWGYTAERANEFSMVLTSAAFYHRYYHTLFTHSLPEALRALADEAPTCVDVLMNFLVAAVTKLPPIKVPYRKQHQEARPPLAPEGRGPRPEPQPPVRNCINQMAAGFGHMPLVSSRLRLDPVLFKDSVSVLRKKYRSLEKP